MCAGQVTAGISNSQPKVRAMKKVYCGRWVKMRHESHLSPALKIAPEMWLHKAPSPKGHKTVPTDGGSPGQGPRRNGLAGLSTETWNKPSPTQGHGDVNKSLSTPNCKSHPLWASPSPSASPHHRILAMQPASCSGDTESLFHPRSVHELCA